MGTSPARAARRLCQRRGHVFRTKTDGHGEPVRLPCERCGEEPVALTISSTVFNERIVGELRVQFAEIQETGDLAAMKAWLTANEIPFEVPSP